MPVTKTFIVATLVSTLVGTFASSHNLYERLAGSQKKKDAGQDDQIKKLQEQIDQFKLKKGDGGEKSDELKDSLKTSGPLIKKEYDVAYDRLGGRFAAGDIITENELQKQIILLQQTVIGVLEDALYNGREIDRACVQKLVNASQAARDGSLEALQGQYQRLIQSAPPGRAPAVVVEEIHSVSGSGRGSSRASSRSSLARPGPPPRALPPSRSKGPPPLPPILSPRKKTGWDFFCRYAIDLQRSSRMPLAATFDPERDSRCPACKVRIPVDSDDMWDIDIHTKFKLPPPATAPSPRAPSPPGSSDKGSPRPGEKPAGRRGEGRGRSRTGKEVVAVAEQRQKMLTFRVPARFVVKCHTPMGDYACVLCCGSCSESGVVVLCDDPESLIHHVATEHKVAEIERDADIIPD